MNKKLIRLTESDLHKIVKESVGRILREDIEPQLQRGEGNNAVELLEIYHNT